MFHSESGEWKIDGGLQDTSLFAPFPAAHYHQRRGGQRGFHICSPSHVRPSGPVHHGKAHPFHEASAIKAEASRHFAVDSLSSAAPHLISDGNA